MIHATNAGSSFVRLGSVLPELSHLDCGEEGGADAIPVFVTLTSRMGSLFQGTPRDLESREAEFEVSRLETLLRAVNPDSLLRLVLRARSSSDAPMGTFRSESLSRLGFLKKELLVSLEKKATEPFSMESWIQWLGTLGSHGTRSKSQVKSAELSAFRASLPLDEFKGAGFQPVSEAELRREMARPESPWMRLDSGIERGEGLTRVVRLYRPGAKPLSLSTLAGLLDEFPLPYEVVVTVKPLSQPRADLKLRSKLARGQPLPDAGSGLRADATEEALLETSLQGGRLYEIEWCVVLTRTDESALRTDSEKVRSLMSRIGDTLIEGVGSVPSFVSTRWGSLPHVSFLEEQSKIPFYLPAFSYGGSEVTRALPQRTLLLHRLDGSLHVYDPFSPKFLAYNSLICGKTGSGKSVFANALSSSLLQDPLIRMIKIDVGGSYKKECEAYGGREVNFRLDVPSGVNPFRVFSKLSSQNEAIEILSELISTLVREEGENQIPKALRAQIEERLKHYAESLSDRPDARASIEEFLALSPDLPRRELLARWTKGGVFENALREDPRLQFVGPEAPLNPALVPPRERYTYYNFENIHGAASRDYAGGVMAAVITMTNLEMLLLSQRAKANSGERLVLFCDETKFFIENSAQFFLLTAANFRKYGHGLILLFQNIRDAEIRRSDGTRDLGLVLNSPIRIFLQADTEGAYLKDQFQFEDHHLRAVVTHPYRGKEYREAVLQDDLGTRVVRLYLTDDEYWRMTSTKEDGEKLRQLRSAAPLLSLDEAIRCLSLTQGRA